MSKRLARLQYADGQVEEILVADAHTLSIRRKGHLLLQVDDDGRVLKYREINDDHRLPEQW